MIEGIRMGLIERKRNVPHLKTFATSGNGDFNKASLIGVDYDTEYAQEFLRDHKNMRMIINARAVCESRPLARLMDDALDEVCDKYDLDCQVFFTECFGMADEGRVAHSRVARGPRATFSRSNSPGLARTAHWAVQARAELAL